MSNKSNVVVIVIILAILALICVCGWAGSTMFINVQLQSCNLLEAGINQLNPETQGVQPTTADECQKAIGLATPFYRIWGWVFTAILAVGAIMFVIAVRMIFGGKPKQTKI